MNKFLLIFICVITQNAFTQNYIVLPQKGFRQAIMHVDNFYDPPYDKSIRYVRDTVMCGDTYAMYCNEYFQNSGQTYSCVSGKFSHFTRYDNGKVYYRFIGCANVDILKYDFNLNMNDTFRIETGSYNDLAVVDSIDAQFLYNNSRRKYIGLRSLGGYARYEWLEGIGDMNKGFFYDVDFEGGKDKLICYKEFNQTLYLNESKYDCDKMLKNMTLSNNETFAKNLKVYVNSTTHFIEMFFEKEASYKIEIIDAIGKSVYLENCYAKEKLISISDFKSGVYFLKLETLDGLDIRKIIIN